MRAGRRRLAALVGVLALCSCGELDLFWIHRYEPVREDVTADLAADRAELQACLDRLGAPHLVWESPQGMALSYAWLNKVYWKFDVTVRFTGIDSLDGRTVFSYNQTNDAYQGAVLLFDDDLRLSVVRHGLLADITRDLKRRPSQIE